MDKELRCKDGKHHELGRCKLLTVIADRGDTEMVSRTLRMAGMMGSTAMLGHGTANLSWLETLGLADNEKVVLFGVLREALVYPAFYLLRQNFSLHHHGTGIAFTMPMLAHTGLRALHRLHEKFEQIPMPEMPEEFKEKKRRIMQEIKELSQMDTKSVEKVERNIEEEDHVLIITVVNRGFSTEVIDAAREAGTQGATTLHGRGLGAHDVEKFMNIRVQPEKEVVFIVAKKAMAKETIAKIAEATNLTTKAHGISFALPLDSVFGLTPMDLSQDEE